MNEQKAMPGMLQNRSINGLLAFFILLFLSAFSANSYVCAQSKKQIAWVDSLAEAYLEELNLAGISIGIVKDGVLWHLGSYGMASLEKEEPLTDEHLFSIASLSKAFTASALGILVDRGKLKWEDQLKSHLPEFRMANDSLSEALSLVDALSHSSGLPLGAGDLISFPDGGDFTVDDLLQCFEYIPPEDEIGSSFKYNNNLYHLSGELLSRSADESFETFVEREIFKKLDMKHTIAVQAGSIWEHPDAGPVASPHASKKDVLRPLRPYEHGINAAAGGIYSNAEDMCRWMLFHLNDGSYGEQLEKRLYSPEVQQDLFAAHNPHLQMRLPESYQSGEGCHYGLGWMHCSLDGAPFFFHTGGMPGMLCQLSLLPEEGLGIVVLTNAYPEGSLAFRGITYSIVDRLRSRESHDWLGQLASDFRSKEGEHADSIKAVWEVVSKASEQWDDADMKRFEGTYVDPWFGEAQILEEEGIWRLQMLRSPRLSGSLHPFSDTCMVVQWDYRDFHCDAFAIFRFPSREESLLIASKKEKASSFRMQGISPDIDFSFDFHHLHFSRKEE